MITIINLGLGVNSTAILAMIETGELVYENPICVFADVGGERPDVYEYLEYLKEVSPLPINIVTANEKDGNLWEYCQKNEILPQRFMRWCTDRWKRKPLEKFLKEHVSETDDWVRVIGIAYDERQRATRWANDPHASFPLIENQIDREGCVKRIKDVGWKVPKKSGCFFCPFVPLDEFVELKKNNRDLYNNVCELEKKILKKYKNMKIKGWYHDKYPLDRLLARKRPISCDGQQLICINCFDGDYVPRISEEKTTGGV